MRLLTRTRLAGVATALAVPVALLAGPGAAHATEPTPTRHLVDLTVLDGGGGTGRANGINRVRDIVGYGNDSNGNSHALLWRQGQPINLGTLRGANSYATAINDRGDVVGYSGVADSGTLHAFLWRAGTMTDLNGIQP